MAVVTAVVGATMGEAAVVDGAMEAATAAVVVAAVCQSLAFQYSGRSEILISLLLGYLIFPNF